MHEAGPQFACPMAPASSLSLLLRDANDLRRQRGLAVYEGVDVRTSGVTEYMGRKCEELPGGFWARLHDFATLGLAPPDWSTVPPSHPFLCRASDDSIVAVLPDAASMPA